MTSQLKYESSDNIAKITISRPEKKNAISADIASELAQAWREFESGSDRVAVITGEGQDAFSAGADVKNPPEEYSFLPGIGLPLTKPVISAVSGWCIGAAVVIVNRTDLCVADEAATFRYPEPKLGIGRGMLASLVNRVPYKSAMEIMLLAETMSAQRMHELGFVNRVAPDGEALKSAMELAATIAAYPPDAVQFIKENALKALPEGPGEYAESIRSRGNTIAGNRGWGEQNK